MGKNLGLSLPLALLTMLAAPVFGQVDNASPRKDDVPAEQKAHFELSLPGAIPAETWLGAIAELQIASPELTEAWNRYAATWKSLDTQIADLEAESISAAKQKDTVEQALSRDKLFKATEDIVTRSQAADDELLRALQVAAGESPVAPRARAICERIQRRQAYAVLKKLPLWAESTTNPEEVLNELRKRDVDLSSAQSILQERLQEATPRIVAAAREGRKALVKDQALFAQYAALMTDPENAQAAAAILEQRGELWRRAVATSKALRNETRSTVELAAQALPEASAEEVRRAFQLSWHPRIYGEGPKFLPMFAKAKEVAGDNAEYSALVDECQREFEERFDRLAKEAVKLDDDWLEKRLSQGAMSNVDMQAYQDARAAFVSDVFKLVRQQWARMLDPLEPEQRSELEKWMSPTAVPGRARPTGTSSGPAPR